MTSCRRLTLSDVLENTIVLDEHTYPFPHEPAVIDGKPLPGVVKHVHCEGARKHVKGYGAGQDVLGNTVSIDSCSCPECIINVKAEQDMAALRDFGEARERQRRADEDPEAALLVRDFIADLEGSRAPRKRRLADLLRGRRP